MNKVSYQLIRLFLRLQKLGQRYASIEFVRCSSRWIEFLFPMPDKVRWTKLARDGQTYEWLIPEELNSEYVLFYIHGGFVFPLSNPTRYIAGHLAKTAGMRAFLVNFRVAPEYPFPAAVDDCRSSYRWLISEGGVEADKVIIVGESAGGNLALATMLSLRDGGDPLPCRSVVISPVVEFEGRGTFYEQNDPMADANFVMRQLNAYRGDADPRDPLLSPLYADLHGLPPLLIQVGAEEMLRSSAEELAMLAKKAGVPTVLEIWPGMWHYWHIFLSILPSAQQALLNINDFLLPIDKASRGP